jgi:hypothetical protein
MCRYFIDIKIAKVTNDVQMALPVTWCERVVLQLSLMIGLFVY